MKRLATYSVNPEIQQILIQTANYRQGSIVALVKQNGTVSERYSYDAWGRRRNPANWADYNVPAPRLIARGYTGHEHLDGFGLINMNGRMYDPVIGRVLSPDNFVQDPTNTQSYNRYSYCLNNPLRYTDPSGWFAAAADQYWNMGKDITDFISFSGRRASSLDGAGGGGQGWGGNGGVLPAWYGGGDYGDFGKQLYFAGITKLNSLPKNDASTLVDWSIDENGRYRFNWADVSWQIIDEAFGFSEGVSREGHSEDICSITPIQVLGFNLTEAEKKIILSHPTIIYALYKNHNLAFDMTYKYFPNVKAEDNAADAFRHAFFNALNTKSFGTDLTTQLGYAHEFWEGNPDLAFKMDIFNNRIGREIGYMYSYMSGDKLSEIVYNAVRYGQTKMIENGKLVPTYIK